MRRQADMRHAGKNIAAGTATVLLLAMTPVAAAETDPGLAKAGMVAAHNAARAGVDRDLPPLEWSASLAALAHGWARTLARDACIMRHNPDRGRVGENLLWAGPRVRRVERWTEPGGPRTTEITTQVQNLDAPAVVQSWADEARWYDAALGNCDAPAGESCGHYTQIIWSGTTHVGCGMAVCNDKGQLWVCNYHPPGNVQGRRPF